MRLGVVPDDGLDEASNEHHGAAHTLQYLRQLSPLEQAWVRLKELRTLDANILSIFYTTAAQISSEPTIVQA